MTDDLLARIDDLTSCPSCGELVDQNALILYGKCNGCAKPEDHRSDAVDHLALVGAALIACPAVLPERTAVPGEPLPDVPAESYPPDSTPLAATEAYAWAPIGDDEASGQSPPKPLSTWQRLTAPFRQRRLARSRRNR